MPFSDPHSVSATVCRCRRGRTIPPIATRRSRISASRCSHPEWLVARWLDRVRFRADRTWVQFNNERAPLTLARQPAAHDARRRAEALAADDVETARTRHSLRMGFASFQATRLRQASHEQFFVQDEASQLVPLAVDAQPGERVLDLCARPAERPSMMAATCAIAVCSSPATSGRAASLCFATPSVRRRAHAHPIHVPTEGPCPSQPTSIACSWMRRARGWAPCGAIPISGGGGTKSELAGLAERQLTCSVAQPTSSDREDDSSTPRVRASLRRTRWSSMRFLATERRLSIARSATIDGSADLAPVLDERGMLRTLPFEHGLEAFFAAALQRTA